MPERCEGLVVVVAGRAQVGHHHSPRVAPQAVLVSRVGLISHTFRNRHNGTKNDGVSGSCVVCMVLAAILLPSGCYYWEIDTH